MSRGGIEDLASQVVGDLERMMDCCLAFFWLCGLSEVNRLALLYSVCKACISTAFGQSHASLCKVCTVHMHVYIS